jgi:hypothetical protein
MKFMNMLFNELQGSAMEELQNLHRHLSAALAIVERMIEPGSADAGSRDPSYFRESGHLSDAGIQALYALFEDGVSIEEAAKRMGISHRGTAARRKAWLDQRQKHGRQNL